MVFLAALMATTVYAQELKSVSFDDYLKTFDYKERKYMKIEIPELMDLYKKGMVQIIDPRSPGSPQRERPWHIPRNG